MNLFSRYILFFTVSVLFPLSSKAIEDVSREALEPTGLVIDALVKEILADRAKVIDINLSRETVNLLNPFTPYLNKNKIKLISINDIKTLIQNGTYSEAQDSSINVKVIVCKKEYAEILAGPPMHELGGFQYRYILRRINDKWTIVNKKSDTIALTKSSGQIQSQAPCPSYGFVLTATRED